MSELSSDLQAAYILHSRPYRETSLLLECLTENHGRVSLVARGVKRRKSALSGTLQLFVPLLVNWYGKGELQTLKTVDVLPQGNLLSGKQLFSAMYVNELLLRVLQKGDACQAIFYLYRQLINSSLGEPNLRYFEKRLLEELGYALQLVKLANTDEAVLLDKHYLFYPEQGVLPVLSENNITAQKFIFSGASLQAIDRNDFSSAEVLKDAKRLMRLAFLPLLNNKPLKTRELFMS